MNKHFKATPTRRRYQTFTLSSNQARGTASAEHTEEEMNTSFPTTFHQLHSLKFSSCHCTRTHQMRLRCRVSSSA
ncbi:hypothetical protein M513_12225 [Trichuris suis]|uniref:Uncharacterized protein n=1 Tax=Trichuris suis TaxID=68888 RepID=A0A085LPK7_9BILA|nr:hypothetical protein M513_12225 [Trichuris suis]